MKVRITMSGDNITHLNSREWKDKYVDDMLMWALETDTSMEFYTWHSVWEKHKLKEMHAVWIIEDDDRTILMLKWNAKKHKQK